MHDIETITTERLLAERMRPEHFDFFLRMWQDPRVMVNMGGVRTTEFVTTRFRQGLAHWEAHGFGRWICRSKSDVELVGYCGLRHLVVEGQPEVDLGYSVIPEMWGQGPATEMAGALLVIAFGSLGLDNVIALTDHDHFASRRVMEKAGLRFERDSKSPKGEPAVLYRIRREEYAG